MPNILAALLVLMIPGWSLLAWLPGDSLFRPSRRRDFVSSLADGAALSIALAALAALLLSLLKIRAGSAALLAFYTLGAGLLAGALIRRGARTPGPDFLLQLGHAAFGLVLLLGAAAWRLHQARGLALPAWVDSVHHALIVNLIIENGGLPADFMPYFPADFHYHFGFHLIAALFTFWARIPASETLLWFGQVLNAAVSLSVYRLTYTLVSETGGEADDLPTRRWFPFTAACMAALLTGFAFQMPAYYLTWGRYTLLAGLILLGPALAAAWELQHEPASKSAGLRLALLLAGICLTHYFVLILAALFLLVLAGAGLARSFHTGQKHQDLAALAGWSGLGIVLALPWLVPVGIAHLEQAGVNLVNPIGQSEAAWQGAIDYLRYIVKMLGPRHNHVLMGLAAAGLLFSLLQGSLGPLAVWGLLLCLFSLPWGLRLELFRPDYFTIVLFFPASILLANLLVRAAAALGGLARSKTAWRAPIRGAGFILMMSFFLIWGMRATRDVINPATVLAGPPDLAALNWIRQNTPQDARFFINSTPWMGQVYRGVDGGYWLEPYTGRFSFVPPALYSLAGRAVTEQVQDWAVRSEKLEGCGAEFWTLVRDAELTHLYLRRGSGALQPDALADCPRLRVLYDQEGVIVYEILRPE